MHPIVKDISPKHLWVAASSVLAPFAGYTLHAHLFHTLLLHQFFPTLSEMESYYAYFTAEKTEAQGACRPPSHKASWENQALTGLWDVSECRALPFLSHYWAGMAGIPDSASCNKWGRQAGSEWWRL